MKVHTQLHVLRVPRLQSRAILPSQNEPEYKLYKKIEPYNTFRIKVSNIHKLYVEEVGNPNGEPILFVHGGPGAGISPLHRQLFDPDHYRAILVDQRGAGKSTPHGEIKDNNTKLLIEDFETIRKKLGIEKWVVFGGSWGSFLGLAYAEAHPKRVTELILRGQVLGLPEENEWLFQEGKIQMLFPERWKIFQETISQKERRNIPKAYFKRLNSPDKNIRQKATYGYYSICNLIKLRELQLPGPEEITDKDMNCARMECYYFMNHCFTNPPDQLLKNAYKLKDIPVTIVNGQYDVLCPPYFANLLNKAIPHSELIIVPDAGHAFDEPGILNALLAALENHKQENTKAKTL